MSPIQERWHAKLENWALWITRGSGSSSCSPLARLADGVRYRFDFTSRPPAPLVGEALDTDRLVSIVAVESPEQYAAIRAWYVWTGTIAERARSLKIHPDTLADRVKAARFRLDDLEQIRRRPRAPLVGYSLAALSS